MSSIPDTHQDFIFLRQETIQSLQLNAQLFQHRETGAQHIHLDTGQDENVFLVAFRTMPMDSTGVAHILEHTSLCGSEKFPVRDPFFMMIRRSLNTFMNAFTSSDWTAYPFASQNKKDFHKMDRKQIFNLQTELINEINKGIGKEVFNNFGPIILKSSPFPGFSIFIISAPRSDNTSVQ